ncbi:hypothetical protein BN14_03704 [Rhizoctonia solani AG-1 IB]|uniref:Fungal zn(2)-Cys(6) binuclear cluster domain-containing protein n=1 Tax=Thanatephorus cucumeris (strain AG1-IB / isolate 7/3/14) TaxID=1108050 RepID=M5BR87_THACB|nr:hypothetical protein BN14_03704 [Rhizoctonia solani AG-1 IB]
MEGCLGSELSFGMASYEARNRLSDWIHVSLMGATFFNGLSTYGILQKVAPVFLQVIYSSPQIWPTGSDLTRVPLLSLLTSASHELAYFALADCTYAMISGLPQRVEYDTAIYSQFSYSSPYQLAHGLPTELSLALADINTCRDKSLHARDWRDIEQSWMTIAWHAVQESWRLALLVYLYLAVCNVSSDDQRVQSRAKQILQVAGTVKKRGPSNASISFGNQYLMAGICARSEADRRIIRDKLGSVDESKLWIIRTSDCLPVLEHLWNGAAAGGRPIKWGDYMRLCEMFLPM